MEQELARAYQKNGVIGLVYITPFRWDYGDYSLRNQDIVNFSLMGLSERKFRFALNLIGIMIGCAAIIGLIGITEGLSVNINAQLGTLGTNTINVVPERTQGPQAQFESGSELDWRDLDLIKDMDHVELVSPTISGKIATYNSRGGTYTSPITGIGPEYLQINEAIGLEMVGSSSEMMTT